MAIPSRYKMSSERLEALKEELNYLETVREKEVAELIKEARSFGDLSENSEYDEAKAEQGKLYSKIAELKESRSAASSRLWIWRRIWKSLMRSLVLRKQTPERAASRMTLPSAKVSTATAQVTLSPSKYEPPPDSRLTELFEAAVLDLSETILFVLFVRRV